MSGLPRLSIDIIVSRMGNDDLFSDSTFQLSPYTSRNTDFSTSVKSYEADGIEDGIDDRNQLEIVDRMEIRQTFVWLAHLEPSVVY